jgi:tetratricopeptide (TPR) repeat protein
MKPFVITLAVLCVAATVGTIIYSNRAKEPRIVAPVPASSPEQPAPPSEKAVTPEPRPAQTVSADANNAKPIPAASISSEPTPADSVKSTPFSRALEVLVSPQSSFDQKQAALKQIKDAKQLDQVIEALKQGAAANPAAPEYQAALGEVYLQQAGIAARAGKSISETAILGMQADQSFDNALKIDSANWDAQFFKAVAMSYWPPELNKADEVLQRFSTLIEQQETMPSQPQFAKTYMLLGEQYQKMGKPDYAAATWQLGATKFPGDPALQKKAVAH